jgi:hypothetical protein
LFVPYRHPFGIGHGANLALDRVQLIDAPHGFVRRRRLFAHIPRQGFDGIEELAPEVGDAAAMDEVRLPGDVIIGVMTVALNDAVRAIQEPTSRIRAAARIVIEEDDPLSGWTGDPHPHPMFRLGWSIALEHLYGRLIDPDVAARPQPLPSATE